MPKISFYFYFYFFCQCCYSFHKESQHSNSNVSSVMGLLNSPSCERDTQCMKWNTVSYSLQHCDFPPVLQSQTWEEACKEQKLMKRSTLQVIYKHLSCFFSLPTALPCTLCFDPSILIFCCDLVFCCDKDMNIKASKPVTSGITEQSTGRKEKWSNTSFRLRNSLVLCFLLLLLFCIHGSCRKEGSETWGRW